jgi:hypothetical protein
MSPGVGCHEELLLHLLPGDCLDSKRLLLDPPLGSAGRHDDSFRLYRLLFEEDRNGRVPDLGKEQPHPRRGVPNAIRLDDVPAQRESEQGHPFGVRQRGG